jgi:phytoene/squalene synthetase
MKKLFDEVSKDCSKLVTRKYSTSFSLGISFLSVGIQDAIYAIYGMVRFADEIVDSFHNYKKRDLLDEFEWKTYQAIEDKISLNPILNSFQEVVNEYSIDMSLIDAFFKSMRMDLEKVDYTPDKYQEYIYGSADVVGLMCLYVFVDGDKKDYQRLKAPAMRLGSAFQKVNFLRDLQNDVQGLDRAYFPNLDFTNFDEDQKQLIIAEIEKDFDAAYKGIIELPKQAKFGVYMAFKYYKSLLHKISRTESSKILTTRIRIPNIQKYNIFLFSYFKHSLNLI